MEDILRELPTHFGLKPLKIHTELAWGIRTKDRLFSELSLPLGTANKS